MWFFFACLFTCVCVCVFCIKSFVVFTLNTNTSIVHLFVYLSRTGTQNDLIAFPNVKMICCEIVPRLPHVSFQPYSQFQNSKSKGFDTLEIKHWMNEPKSELFTKLSKNFVHAGKWRLHKFFCVIYFVLIQKAVRPTHLVSAGFKGQED